MTAPLLSVVIPALNEEGLIDSSLARISRFLDSRHASWEIIVADDGSTDSTVARAQQWTKADPRVQLVTSAHVGKGAAVRRGMMTARGAWKLMADADLSVSPEDWSVLLDAAGTPHAADVILASREAAGARRVGEPLPRHLIGRVFNWIVRLLVVRGIHDTQCGFKLFSAEAAAAVFPHLTVEGFAFDVELLFLAKRAGLRTREVGVLWTCRRGGRVAVARGAVAFLDILRIRWNHFRGRYDRVGATGPAPHPERGLDAMASDGTSAVQQGGSRPI